MPISKLPLTATFTSKDVKILEKRTAFKGFFTMLVYRFQHKMFSGAWSAEIEREVFERGEAAAAILYDVKTDRVGLVEQFRSGALNSEYGPWCLETVAGMVEEGETPEQVIRREIVEEAGVEHCELREISEYYSTPGGCSEKIYLYCALCDLSNAEGLYGLGSENEDIRLHTVPALDVFPVMLKSRMNNAATLLALQWLQLNRDNLRNEFKGTL